MSDNHTFTFDLKLLEMALQKSIELCNAESDLLNNKLKISQDALNEISQEKEDVMNFIEWHIPLIVRYIKMHKNNFHDDISNLAERTKLIHAAAQNEIQKKLPKQKVIGNTKTSTMTILSQNFKNKQIVNVTFVNDTNDMPVTIERLLKEMISALEINFHKIFTRKKLNDQILEIAGETIAQTNNMNYNPRKKKHSNSTNLILNEDC